MRVWPQTVYEDAGAGTLRTLLSGTDVLSGGTDWLVLPLWASGTGQASAARADLHGARAAAAALDHVVRLAAFTLLPRGRVWAFVLLGPRRR